MVGFRVARAPSRQESGRRDLAEHPSNLLEGHDGLSHHWPCRVFPQESPHDVQSPAEKSDLIAGTLKAREDGRSRGRIGQQPVRLASKLRIDAEDRRVCGIREEDRRRRANMNRSLKQPSQAGACSPEDEFAGMSNRQRRLDDITTRSLERSQGGGSSLPEPMRLQRENREPSISPLRRQGRIEQLGFSPPQESSVKNQEPNEGPESFEKPRHFRSGELYTLEVDRHRRPVCPASKGC